MSAARVDSCSRVSLRQKWTSEGRCDEETSGWGLKWETGWGCMGSRYIVYVCEKFQVIS